MKLLLVLLLLLLQVCGPTTTAIASPVNIAHILRNQKLHPGIKASQHNQSKQNMQNKSQTLQSTQSSQTQTDHD
jgi:hypothetical protein